MRLAEWSGTPLEPCNLGAMIEPGTLVCLVGDERKLMVELLVREQDVARIVPGQEVRMWLDQRPGEILHGEVTEIARREGGDPLADRGGGREAATENPMQTLFAGMLASGTGGTHYRVRVEFDGDGYALATADAAGGEVRTRTTVPPLVIGGRGTAKIATAPMTLGGRLMRWATQTFRLPM